MSNPITKLQQIILQEIGDQPGITLGVLLSHTADYCAKEVTGELLNLEHHGLIQVSGDPQSPELSFTLASCRETIEY